MDGKILKGAVCANVDRSSMILIDEWGGYQGLHKEFKGGHYTVNHGAGEYAVGGLGSNTAESYFALLKRIIIGAYTMSRCNVHIAIVMCSRSTGTLAQ